MRVNIYATQKNDYNDVESTFNKILEDDKGIEGMAVFFTVGYKKILEKILKQKSSNIPIIGGSVTAYMSQDGVYTRGIAIIVFYDSGFENFLIPFKKKNIDSVCKQLDSVADGRLTFLMGPGTTEPKLANLSNAENRIAKMSKKIITRFKGKLLSSAVNVYNYGPGFEEAYLSKLSQNRELFGLSTFDDYKALTNYQIYNDQIIKNGSLVGVGFKKSKIRQLKHICPLTATDKIMVATKLGWKKYIIDKINNKPAFEEYLKTMKWPEEYIKDHVYEIIQKTFYYPLGKLEYTDDMVYAFPPGFFFGGSIATNREVPKKIRVYTTSAPKIFDFVKSCKTQSPDGLAFMSFGFPVIGILGDKLYVVNDILKKNIKCPYLVVFGCGEYSKLKNKKPLFTDYGLLFLHMVDK